MEESLSRRPRFENDREAQIERQQVEEVLRLGGGELENEPWMYWLSHRMSDGMPYGDTIDDFYEGRSHYWYEGAPDGSELKDSACRNLRTLITFGGGFMDAPDPELFDEAGVWKLVHCWNHSGETECPARVWNPITGREESRHLGDERRPRLVIEEEAALEPRAGDRCPLCEEAVGEEHGFVGIGEGYEATYELIEQTAGQRMIEEILDDEITEVVKPHMSLGDVKLTILLEAVAVSGLDYDKLVKALWQLVLARREEG